MNARSDSPKLVSKKQDLGPNIHHVGSDTVLTPQIRHMQGPMTSTLEAGIY